MRARTTGSTESERRVAEQRVAHRLDRVGDGIGLRRRRKPAGQQVEGK